jgi:predicted dehydrogenase
LRAAIIGYGVSGRLSHAYGLQANPEFRIVAACDADAANRAQAERDLGCPVYSTHQELLEAEQLDLASVVTRSDTHAAIACDCLRAGVHTVVTKPWALNEAEAQAMLAAQRESGRQLFPWIPMYWSPDYRLISSLLDQNVIGEVFLIRRHCTDFRRRHDWQTELRYGGGYLLNWGMHIVQPVIALARSPLRRVYGQLLQTINPGDAEDNFLAVMEFANGIRGIAEFTESLFPLPSFLVQGTRGTILADARSVTVATKDPGDPEPATEQIHPLTGKQYGDEADIYRDIAASLLHGAPFPVTPAFALQGTRALAAIRRSHEGRTSITSS